MNFFNQLNQIEQLFFLLPPFSLYYTLIIKRIEVIHITTVVINIDKNFK